MRTLDDATRLLARTAHLDDVTPLAAALGFRFAPGPLTALERQGLGLPPTVRRARIAEGRAPLRLVAVEVAEDPQVEGVAIARLLTRRIPEARWMVLAVDERGGRLAIAVQVGTLPAHVLSTAPDAVRPSDAETVRLLAAARTDDPLETHRRWHEILGRDGLGDRFYRALERHVGALAASMEGRVPEAARRALAMVTTSRLLFLAFLQAKGWLDGDADFLQRHTTRLAGRLHARLLDPLAFGTLNTPMRRRAAAVRAFGAVPFLNGGLFARTPLESRWRAHRFGDDAIAAITCGLLPAYRVTMRERQRDWAEAAVDPEMLGRAFESLMDVGARRDSGSFYTPPALVERTVSLALDRWLAVLPADDREGRRARLAAVRVLDPACGSGAFLVQALEAVVARLGMLGDVRPAVQRRREVLTRSIFGVDRLPLAAWLCELRLWLATVVDDPERDPSRVAPLPNLDRNIRVGDALGPFEGPAGATEAACTAAPAGRGLAALRLRYTRAVGARKRMLGRALDRGERALAIAAIDRSLAQLQHRRRDLLASARGRDLFGQRRAGGAEVTRALRALREARRALGAARTSLTLGGALPFRWETHFAATTAAGGFDVLVGNPPWVRPHRLPPAEREALRARFRVVRDAAWRSGADATGAGVGFAAQADLSAAFLERGIALVRPGGIVALVVPAKLWSALAGGGVRRLLLDESILHHLEDLQGATARFAAAVYPSLVVVERAVMPAARALVHAAVHDGDARREWRTAARRLPLDDTPGAPWVIAPDAVRRAFDLLADAGTPLASHASGRPMLGVKTGCNDAFVGPAATLVDAVEPALLRPCLRGEHIRPWRAAGGDARIVWTHDAAGRPLRALPAGARAWLARSGGALARRTDTRPGLPPWTLFRTAAADASRCRVAWADIGREVRAAVLERHDPTVPLNSCYVVRAPTRADALALCALLNAPLASAWLACIAEPARGGYRRFLGWVMARLPLPTDWGRAVALLAPIAEQALAGTTPEPGVLDRACADAFGIPPARLAPLLRWTATSRG